MDLRVKVKDNFSVVVNQGMVGTMVGVTGMGGTMMGGTGMGGTGMSKGVVVGNGFTANLGSSRSKIMGNLSMVNNSINVS